ncbi:MAG TPA: hypothetical protein VM097_02885 [Mycobacteriales bacterium]|nr:hypothetical protein [Mycobacteriales bacterium]
MSRIRTALLATALCVAALPALAAADPADCLTPDADGVLCMAAEAGGIVQQAESPLVGPRDAVRGAGDTALERAGLCDPLDHAACLLPFPSDRWTVADPTTATGRRISLSPAQMPRNVANKPMDPTELNKNDGWSQGTPVLTSVPGLDLRRTGLATEADPGASLRADAPAILLDTATGQRWPYTADLDANPTDGEQPLLILRPAISFKEGHRYVVALRNLRNAAGATIPAGSEFAARRATATTGDPVFGPLMRKGIRVKDLYLAWTFTIASTRSNTERMLHIRDDAFASLAGKAPSFEVTGNEAGYSERVARRVTGTFTVPNYLTTPVNGQEPLLGTDPGLPGTRFLYLPGDELPDRNGDFTATFTCDIPVSASQRRPARGSIYGHGLLGGQGEVGASNVQKMGQENNILFCATDWYGMATGDVPNVATMLADMSFFPTLPDRVQQGMLAQLFLARLLKDARGFASDPAFQAGGKPLHKPGSVFYDGNSQGGIIGGALLAVSQDITRGVLGVPGMNYSTLLDRSVDFAQYESVFNAAYPSEVDRELVFGLIQPLWDRGENNGYAAHITRNPLPRTPVHQVLLDVGYGDHQVSNFTAEVMARTIGARTNAGFLGRGRHWGVQPGWGLLRFRGSWAGSAIVYWDSGTSRPPLTNVPPAEGPGLAGHDPHEDPRATYLARVQKGLFLRPNGVVVDVCAGRPCLARPLGPEDPPKR